MATLASLGNFDSASFINAAEAGSRRRSLADLGALAAQGNYRGASGAAFASGDPALGASMLDLSNQETRRRFEQGATQLLGANSPGEWNRLRATAIQNGGQDVGPWENRDSVFAELLGPAGFLSYQQQREAAARANAAATAPNYRYDEVNGRIVQINERTGEAREIYSAPGGNPADLMSVAPGNTVLDPSTGQVVYTAPNRPNQVVTAGDRTAILEADQQIRAGTQVAAALNRLLTLNDPNKSFAGPGAEWRSGVMAPMGNQEAANTQVMQNIITTQALDALRATFGAMPTEGERKILIDIQGSVNQTTAVREEIWKRALAAVEARIAYNTNLAQSLRTGEFYQPGYGQLPATATTPPGAAPPAGAPAPIGAPPAAPPATGGPAAQAPAAIGSAFSSPSYFPPSPGQPAAASGGQAPAAPSDGLPVRITTDAEFNALPSGTLFVDPEGNVRRKP